MLVNAQIYIGNMTTTKVNAITGLSASELRSMTGFNVVAQGGNPWSGHMDIACTRDDCLATWKIDADETAPNFAGEAFVREDFVEAILDIVADVA